MEMLLPVIDLEPYLLATISCHADGDPLSNSINHNKPVVELCQRVASCLQEAGALIVRDPRCSFRDNDRFLDMMELYFGQPDEFKRQQERPHLHYQVGVTPEGVELPRCVVDRNIQQQIQELPEERRPHMSLGPDAKWRYMWRVGPRPEKTSFQELNSEPVVPDGFPDWVEVMDGWGKKMIAAVEVVAEMAAIGFGLPQSAFTSLMSQGPHLLAPTGSDLSKYSEEGSIFAGYHYDLNFLTIHGKSRFPGLVIWLRSGEKFSVHVPSGCLLVQAGKQLEWLTGGECSAGMHEVVVTQETQRAMQAARKVGSSLWRVSSSVFGHIASDAILQPLGKFVNSPYAYKYPATRAGDYVESELAAIKLKI